MKEANFLEKLLDGEKVEWKALEEVASFRRWSFPQPYGNSEWYDGEGSMPFVQVVDVLDGGFSLKKNTKQKISKLAQPKSVFVEEGTVIVTLQGTIGRVAVTQYDCYLDRTLAIFTNYVQGINKKYFAYQLKSKFDIEKENARGSTLKTITKEEFSKFKIPIPCPENRKKSLEIQAEIVRILDNFTALTAELTAELTARKKQYAYYRDQLLTFAEGEVEWKPLRDLVKIKHGKDWKGLGAGDIPIYGSGGVMGYVDKYSYNKPTVLIPRKGSITNIFYLEAPFWNVDTIYYTEIDCFQVVPKFLYYYIKTIDLMALDAGSGRPSLTQAILNQIPIPIPYADDPKKSLAEQARIVAILDKFDTLTNSLQEGLPREIELRQKQYEYYRDLLLNFPKN